MRAYNKLGAGFMFVIAGGCLFVAWVWLGSEGGVAATVFWLVFSLFFVALGVYALRQR